VPSSSITNHRPCSGLRLGATRACTASTSPLLSSPSALRGKEARRHGGGSACQRSLPRALENMRVAPPRAKPLDLELVQLVPDPGGERGSGGGPGADETRSAGGAAHTPVLYAPQNVPGRGRSRHARGRRARPVWRITQMECPGRRQILNLVAFESARPRHGAYVAARRSRRRSAGSSRAACGGAAPPW
jgi:hypothetical protein